MLKLIGSALWNGILFVFDFYGGWVFSPKFEGFYNKGEMMGLECDLTEDERI